ncbi:MAG: hypothetical protein ACOY90_12325 [Candidatus Zhuqueibacterota bacterium]
MVASKFGGEICLRDLEIVAVHELTKYIRSEHQFQVKVFALLLLQQEKAPGSGCNGRQAPFTGGAKIDSKVNSWFVGAKEAAAAMRRFFRERELVGFSGDWHDDRRN